MADASPAVSFRGPEGYGTNPSTEDSEREMEDSPYLAAFRGNEATPASHASVSGAARLAAIEEDQLALPPGLPIGFRGVWEAGGASNIGQQGRARAGPGWGQLGLPSYATGVAAITPMPGMNLASAPQGGGLYAHGEPPGSQWGGASEGGYPLQGFPRGLRQGQGREGVLRVEAVIL